MRSCDELHTDLVAYLDQELDPQARERLDVHLRSCSECRAELETLGQVLGRIVDAPATEPSQDFGRRFWARFEQERGVRVWRAWWSRLARPRWALLAGSSLAALLVVGGLMLRSADPGASRDELLIAKHLELFADYEAIEQLDLLEDLDAIEALSDEG